MHLLVLLLIMLLVPRVVDGQSVKGSAPPPPPPPVEEPQPPASPSEPYVGAPQCATHDNRAFHTLWNAQLGCYYDHHHGADPHALDYRFGTSLFAQMGGEVSHPWQTSSPAGLENDAKHAGYYWHVYDNIPRGFRLSCGVGGCQQVPQTSWIRAFRLLVHQHPSGRDAAVRFHSGVFEAEVFNEATGRVGYVQIPGMWIDFGDLLINGAKHIDEVVGGNVNENEPGRHKQHGNAGSPQIIWYGANHGTSVPDRGGRIMRGLVSISTSVHDVWDYTQPSNPSDFSDVICAQPITTACRSNATTLRPHLVVVSGQSARLPGMLAILDPDGNGVVDFSGYFNRYGVPQQAGVCSASSLDCVPVVISGVETATNYACDSGSCSGRFVDHDIYINNRPAGYAKPVN